MENLSADKQIKANTPSVNTLVNNHNYFSGNILKNCSNSNKLIIYHHNIWGISSKIDELWTSLCYNRPQIICLTEHHLKTDEINNTNLDQYTLGASFCRKKTNVEVFVYIFVNIFNLALLI